MFLQAMQEVMKDVDEKIVIDDTSKGGGDGVVKFLPLGDMMSRPAPAAKGGK